MNTFTRRLATLVVAAGLGAGGIAVTSAPAQAAADTSWGRTGIVAADTSDTDESQDLDTSWGRGFSTGVPTTTTTSAIDTSWGR